MIPSYVGYDSLTNFLIFSILPLEREEVK